MSSAFFILFFVICCDAGWIRILTNYTNNYFVIDNGICQKREMISSLSSTRHFNGLFQYEIAGIKYENAGNLNCGIYKHFRGTYTCCKPGKPCCLFVNNSDHNVVCPYSDKIYLYVKMAIINIFVVSYFILSYIEYLR